MRSTLKKLTIDASGLKKQWLALTQNEVVQAEAALKSRGLPTAPAAADNAAEEGCEHLPPGGIGGDTSNVSKFLREICCLPLFNPEV